jgi:hypothetical protein
MDGLPITSQEREKKRTLKDSLDKFYHVNAEANEIAELSEKIAEKFFNPHDEPVPDNPGNPEAKKQPQNIVEVFDSASEMIQDNHNVIRDNLIRILEMME